VKASSTNRARTPTQWLQ